VDRLHAGRDAGRGGGLRPLWGRVGDRFGNKLLVQRSLFSCVFVMTAMGLATQPWQLFVLRALQGLVAGYGPLTIRDGGRVGAARQDGARDRLVQTAQRVAPAVGPVIGCVLAQAVGLRNSFFVACAVYGLAFLLAACCSVEQSHPAREGGAAGARADCARSSRFAI
jgi:DHA1 family multidrug resistance protein-like MFS transporter